MTGPSPQSCAGCRPPAAPAVGAAACLCWGAGGRRRRRLGGGGGGDGVGRGGSSGGGGAGFVRCGVGGAGTGISGWGSSVARSRPAATASALPSRRRAVDGIGAGPGNGWGGGVGDHPKAGHSAGGGCVARELQEVRGGGGREGTGGGGLSPRGSCHVTEAGDAKPVDWRGRGGGGGGRGGGGEGTSAHAWEPRGSHLLC